MINIIAEIGINHNGSLDTAMTLVRKAKEAGADTAKFQMFSSQKLWGDDRIKQYEFDDDEWEDLKGWCDLKDIEFLVTPFGVKEVQKCVDLGVRRIKISSGCVMRRDLTQAAVKTGLPLLVSTGMCDEHDLWVISKWFPDDSVLMHCTSAYPCPIEEVNLLVLTRMRMFDYPLGYSDHTEGIFVAPLAVAAGAVVIEKHLTLDRNLNGPDHKASIEPKDFKEMVIQIRNVEKALGSPDKKVQPSEMTLRKVWRDQRP